MADPSSKSQLQRRGRKKKKKGLFHPSKRTYLDEKLLQLMKVFTPIPFKTLDLSSLSTTHENLLKRAGLWEFLRLKFDPELRPDLIAELIVSYDPQADPHRRCFVNGRPLMFTRTQLGCALRLPPRKKATGKEEEEGERFCTGFEVISDEEVLFLESVILKSVVLCSGEDDMEDDVLKVIRLMKEERRPELVDWIGLVWVMVEKELEKGVELRKCYYASHLEWFLRKHRPTLFAKRVGKLEFDDLGVKKFELGISGVDEKESEKKVKGLIMYQRGKRKSGEMVCSEGKDSEESEKGSGLGFGLEKQLGGSIFGHEESKNEEKLEVDNFGGNPKESVVGGLCEEGGYSVGRKSFVDVDSVEEEVINEGLENVEGGLRLMQDGEGNELECVCLMKEGEDGEEKVGSESIRLIADVGKEDDCKVDLLFEGECMVDLKVSGSDDAYIIGIGNEEHDSLVQSSEQDNLADVNISGVELITDSGENNVVGDERSGVNSGKFDDQPLIELENDKDGLSSFHDGNVYEGECLMKESEDRGGEGQKDNMCLIIGEGKKDESKADVSVEGGDTEMGGCEDGVKQMENELLDCLIVHGKDDQLNVLVEDIGLVSVEKRVEQEFKEKQLEYEPIHLTQDKSENRDLEIGERSYVEMVVVSETEVEDRSLDLCLLEEGEDIKKSTADDDNNGKQMEIGQISVSSDDVANLKISGADSITEHEDSNVVGEERSGVNGGKFDDQPLIGLEIGKDGLSSIQDGNVYVLVGECLMKESEDRGGEAQKNDNICLITGEGKKDESKVDFSIKGGDTEMAGYDDICAMQGGEEDNVTDVHMEGSYDDGVKKMENELPEYLTEEGENDKFKLDVLVKDKGLISVESKVEQEFKEKEVEYEPICLTQDKCDNRDLEIGKGSDVQMLVVSEKEVEDGSLDMSLLQGEMKVEGPLKEEEDIKVSSASADDDNGKQMEISFEHGNSVSSSGNQLESTHIELCRRQSSDGTDFIEVVKEENIVDQSMDAEYESQFEKVVEVREEEDNADFKDMEEDQYKESPLQHCSPKIDTLSDSVSEKAVEISDEDSPHNDCSVVEPFVSRTSMMDQDFFGNASNRKNSCENDVFVEPFVEILNDGHKRPRTEGLSEKKPMTNANMSSSSMFPLKRKMNFTNDGHVRVRIGGQSNKDLSDISSWGEQVDFLLGQTKMVVAAKEAAWLSAQQEEQMLSKKLEQQDNIIHLLEKTKHEELQKRNSKINCLENELFFMANQIDHYKKALETTRQTFSTFRERCKLPEEPLYVDIPESGGIVLSSNEWEKERLRREQEERNSRLDTMITNFQLHWFDKFEGHKERIKTLGDRLSDVENEVKDLKITFQNRIFGE